MLTINIPLAGSDKSPCALLTSATLYNGLPAFGTIQKGTYEFAGITVSIDQSAKEQLNEFMEDLLVAYEKILGI